MTERFDLLVSGGGLAGCAVAALAAGRGARVLVVERGAYPAEKVCGEFVSAQGCRVLERLGLIDELRAGGAVPIRGFRLTDPAGRRLDGALPQGGANGGDGLGVSRALLDGRLAERARRAGAVVLERHEAVEPLLEGRRVVGLRVAPRARGSTPRDLRGLVVAADGRRSLLARRLHPALCGPSRSGPRSWFGLRTHLAADPGVLEGRVELHVFDGGYAGLAGVEDRRLNLCTLARAGALRACGGRPERLLRERILANPAARERIGEARPVGRWSSVGPLGWGARKPAAAGALFVGDAAGTIDPWSGDGMSHALRSAELALPFLAAALERGALDDELARAWSSAWSRAFHGVTRRVRLLGRLLERPRAARFTMALLRGPAAAWLPRLAASTR